MHIFLESMRAENALPNTYYGVSAKGWMTSAIMLDWFSNFIEQVTERPLLLLFDGHLTHFSIDVIKKAMDNDIILMKLPPHVTDVMQPLDVGMFSPLKKAWENLLNKNISIREKSSLNKSTFVSMLCSIWRDCMTANNAISGFRATGIYPCDPLKYPTDRFDKRLMLKFNDWVNAGRPAARSQYDDAVGDKELPLEANIEFTIDEQLPSTSKQADCVLLLPSTSKQIPLMSTTISTPLIQPTEIDELVIPPIPYPAPPGFRWKVRLELERIETPNPLSNKSFEEVILSIAKPPKETSKKSRKRLGFNTNVVTDQEFFGRVGKEERGRAVKRRKERRKTSCPSIKGRKENIENTNEEKSKWQRF